MSEARIKQLQAMLRQREGKDGFKANAEAIRAEIRRLGGKA